MRRIIAVVAALAVAAAWDGPTPAASEDGISVYFSPRGGCTEAIIDEILDAKQSVLVQADSFTSNPIALALLRAHKRGVSVRVVLDSSQLTAEYSFFFHYWGIPVKLDADHAIAHNKVMVIDERTIITGSFTFSWAAEARNAENLLIITGKPDLARAYVDNIGEHLAHSEPYGPVEEVEPDEASVAAAVYVNPNGKMYHRKGCRRVRADAKLYGVNETKGAGLSPCRVCKPGE